MKIVAFRNALLTCICLSELISHINAKNELDKIKDVFSKRLLKEIGLHLLKSKQNNTECIGDINLWYNSLTKQKSLWPFQMLDSWGKIPAGIIKMNLYSFGQFDECINIKNSRIKGKYCFADFIIDRALISSMQNLNESEKGNQRTDTPNLIGGDGLIHYMNGVCFPESCDSVEMENLLKMFFNVVDVKLNFTINEDTCVTNEPAVWKSIDWVAFAISIFIALLVVLSTTYDLVTKFWRKKEKNFRWHRLMITFSIINNTKTISSYNNSSGDIKCLHGLRFFSTLWIVYHHRCLFQYLVPATNITDVFDILRNIMASTFLSASFSVDTFLVLSGLLMAYTTFNGLKSGKPFEVLSTYRRRLVRITPVLAAVVLFYASLLKYVGNGPIWNLMIVKRDVNNCENYWWCTLLYINNYKHMDSLCLGHSWYLSLDMQLYLLSPILIYPILRWKKFGWIFVAFWILIGQIYRFVMSYHYHFQASLATADDHKREIYLQIQTRAVPWLIGFLLGYFLHLKSKIIINKVVVVTLWIFSLTIMGAVIIATVHLHYFDHVVTHIEDTSYIAFSRNAWAICISWIIIACNYGYGGPINWFLSLRIWEIMGKLSFSIYLVHIPILLIQLGSIKNPPFISFFEKIRAFFSDTVISIIVAYFTTISIELPFINLESIMFPKKKKEKSSEMILSTPVVIETVANPS